MAMPYFKLFAEFASDPKVQVMSEPMQRRLVMVFCLHSSGDLLYLDEAQLAMTLRISMSDLGKTKATFLKMGFIEDDWRPRNWDKRQECSDPKAAQRMRNFRERHQTKAERARNNGVTLRARSEPVTSGVTENVTAQLRPDVRCKIKEEINPNSAPGNASVSPTCAPAREGEADVHPPTRLPTPAEQRELERREIAERLRMNGLEPE